MVNNSQVLFRKGYGYADFESKKPVIADQTLFRPGSFSKLFTATAVMQLVEQGKLDLDRDVNGYVDFVIPKTYPEPITLRRLLTHTAGFEETLKNLFVAHESDMKPLSTYLVNQMPARVYPPDTPRIPITDSHWPATSWSESAAKSLSATSTITF